ncbi:MAG: hypothetical protein LC732_11875, partial [Acidobacteria bacterium]|nr:hypothetical protein [Acidobacteriota bacterium]
ACKLAPGLYDLPITIEIQRALEDLGRDRLASSQDDPDAADSHDLLGRHLAVIVRQVLLSLRPEVRLQRQVSPFHYFGVHDSIDLLSVRWVRASYEIGELENLYTGNHARVRQIVADAKRR